MKLYFQTSEITCLFVVVFKYDINKMFKHLKSVCIALYNKPYAFSISLTFLYLFRFFIYYLSLNKHKDHDVKNDG